jgi:hypothetical protein
VTAALVVIGVLLLILVSALYDLLRQTRAELQELTDTVYLLVDHHDEDEPEEIFIGAIDFDEIRRIHRVGG